jgi:pectate lyase
MNNKILLIFITCFLFHNVHVLAEGPIGWASVNAFDQDGTTGGEGGEVVTVSNMADLTLYAGKTEALIIQIEGMIKISPKGRFVEVNSNKTIVGKVPGSGITEGGFRVGSGKKNIIFRNLHITDTYKEGDWDGKDQDWDGIQIKGTCHHIWVDHCTILRQGDGALDITNGASYITISWSIIGQNNKASLIGSSDSDTHTDKYKVTIHHTWYNETTQRNPRVRFGMVHLFNNYYYNMGGYGRAMGYSNSNGYAIGVGVAAQIYSENNHFEKVVNPTDFYDSQTLPGYIIDKGSIFENSGAMTTKPDGITWNPADYYSYTLTDAELVKELVMSQAGAEKVVTNLADGVINNNVFTLENYPNPFTEFTRIIIDVPTRGNANIAVMDITGRVVREINDLDVHAGRNETIINREDLKTGIYLLHLKFEGKSITRRMVIQ